MKNLFYSLFLTTFLSRAIAQSEIYAIAYKGGRNGVIDIKGGIVVPFEYMDIKFGTDPIYGETPGPRIWRAKKSSGWGLIDEYGKPLQDYFGLDKISDFTDGLAATNAGFINTASNIVLGHQYIRGSEFRNGLATLFGGLINKKGEWVVESKNDELSCDRVRSLCSFRKGTKWGVMDGRGNHLVDPQFDWIYIPWFLQTKIRTLSTRMGNKWGVIDLKGKVILSNQFEEIVPREYKNQVYYVATKDGLASLYSDAGDLLIGPKFESIFFTRGEHHIIARTNGLVGAIDLAGNVELPFKFTEIRACKNEGEPFIGKMFGEDAFRAFDNNGNALSEKFEEINCFSNGMALVNGKSEPVGYIDTTGKLVVKTQYGTYSGDFDHGVAVVNDLKTGKWGAIDKKGNTILPFSYDHLESFRSF